MYFLERQFYQIVTIYITYTMRLVLSQYTKHIHHDIKKIINAVKGGLKRTCRYVQKIKNKHSKTEKEESKENI